MPKNKSGEEDWFSTVEQEIEVNRPKVQVIADDDIFVEKPTVRKSRLNNNGNNGGAVLKKTQEFLSSKGVGWLMETVEKPTTLLTGETAAEIGEPSIL